MYSKEGLHALMQIMTEMSDDDDLARHFAFSVTLQTDASNTFYAKVAFQNEPVDPNNLTLDEKMMLLYGENYGDGVPWAEEGRLYTAGKNNLLYKHSLIYVFLYNFLKRNFFCLNFHL